MCYLAPNGKQSIGKTTPKAKLGFNSPAFMIWTKSSSKLDHILFSFNDTAYKKT